VHDEELDSILKGSATEDTDDSDELSVVLELSLEKEIPLHDSGNRECTDES